MSQLQRKRHGRPLAIRHDGLSAIRHDGLSTDRHERLSTNQHGRLWTNGHEIVALKAQTRAPHTGIVSREGGGTVIPTLGGGMGSFRGRRAPTVRSVEAGPGMSHNTLLVFELTILVLAIFLGFEVISKVPTLLHTPLMSGTNAIHGIVLVGAMIVLAQPHKDAFEWIVGFLGVVLGSANVVGGFVVTDRMLEMFKKREPAKGRTPRATAAERRMSTNLANLLYLIPIVAFILALRFLSNPAHARRGNQIGAVGMLVAIVVTWIKAGSASWWAIVIGMVIGGGFGAVAARRVKMTAMPQMVALFNGVGGGAAALIALAELHRILPEPGGPKIDIALAIALSGLIGAISFAGSMVAFAKLQELIRGRPITYPGQKFVNLAAPRGAVSRQHDARLRRSAGVAARGRDRRSARSSGFSSCCRSAAPTCPS